MRVIVAHNAYLQRGGEDAVVASEIDLLRDNGHDVVEYRRENSELAKMSTLRAIEDAFWSRQTVREVDGLIRRFEPDLIHAHNTFPLISPSLYWVAYHRRTAVVQTLHNFRLLCPQATFLREGRICEACLGRQPWRGALWGCYHNSYLQSSVVAGMLASHRAINTFRDKVTRYIALSEFGRRMFVAGGLPSSRIVVKPNFADVALAPSMDRAGGLFVGRLSPEKGIDVLLRALDRVGHTGFKIIGEGPEEAKARRHTGVDFVGWQEWSETIGAMRRASYLVQPSICYESFGRTVVEAFGCGVPVIASRLGALQELVRDGVTGLLFQPGSGEDLAEKMLWAEHHPDAMREMGCNARAEYEARYAPRKNLEQLVAIYGGAVAEMRARPAAV